MLRTPPRVSGKEGDKADSREKGKQTVTQNTRKVLRSPVLTNLATTQTGVSVDRELGQISVGTIVANKEATANTATHIEVLGFASSPGGIINHTQMESPAPAPVLVDIGNNTLANEARAGGVIAEGSSVEFLTVLCEELTIMSSILKGMGAAIKKQPNVSKIIKDSVPKLEENLDKLQHMAKSWSKTQRADRELTAAGLYKDGGKRTAASPPTADAQTIPKKVKSDSGIEKPAQRGEGPSNELQKQGEFSMGVTQVNGREWTTVTRKIVNQPEKKAPLKAPAVSIDSEDKVKKKKRQRRRNGVRKNEKHDAILLKPTEGKSYSDVLTAVRTKVNPESCGVQVRSLRKTKTGELLVELQKSSSENRNVFQLALQEAAGESCRVKELVPKVKLEIRDIDDCTSVEEVKAGIQNALENYKGSLEISLTKPNKRGQRMAIASVEKPAGNALLQQGKIKLGWINCSIRRRVEVLKCFKCLGYGHLVSTCTGPDRSNRCFQCGAAGHKASDCKSQPICYLCADKDEDGRKHMAGSGSCGAFRTALEKAKLKQ